MLLACSDVTRQEQGAGELDALMARSPPIADVDVLTAIHDFASFRDDSRDVFKSIWVRAAKARPQDKRLVKTWFERMFLSRQYREAQEASIAYKTRFPQEHQAHLWYIVTCYLLARNEESDQILRTVNQGLMLGNLAKAAQAVAQAGQPPAKGLVLESSEDLLFLLRAYRSQHKFKEALKILEDERTGISSPFGKSNWQLVRNKIDLLSLSDQPQEMLQFCSMLLDDAQPEAMADDARTPHFAFGSLGDDWKVWDGLITAAAKLHYNE